MILLMLGCSGAPSSPWTREAALTPTATIDGSAALSEADYTRRAYAAIPFAEADTDGSGTLSAAELAVLITRQDPLTFDRARPMQALDRQKWSTPFSEPRLQRVTWELLAFLRAEVAAAAPEAVLPDDDALQAAAATEDLHSEAVQGVLRALQALHVEHGLVFPDGLIDTP